VALMFFNGGAMRGGYHLLDGSPYVESTTTAPNTRFYAVGDQCPALYPVSHGGASVTGEVTTSRWIPCEIAYFRQPSRTSWSSAWWRWRTGARRSRAAASRPYTSHVRRCRGHPSTPPSAGTVRGGRRSLRAGGAAVPPGRGRASPRTFAVATRLTRSPRRPTATVTPRSGTCRGVVAAAAASRTPSSRPPAPPRRSSSCGSAGSTRSRKESSETSYTYRD